MTLRELAAVMFVILVIPAIVVPYRMRQTQAMHLTVCTHTMKQIGRALRGYHDEHGCFPPPYTVDENGNRLHSWRTLILPYLEEEELYERIRLDEPWDSEHNRQFASHEIIAYHCPARRDSGEKRRDPRTDYVMITGLGTFGEKIEGIRLEDITDHMDLHFATVMVAEVAQSDIHWMEPRDYDLAAGPHRLVARPRGSIGPTDLSSCHPGVVNMLMVDGSAKSVSVDIDEETLRALMTIAGGEEVELE